MFGILWLFFDNIWYSWPRTIQVHIANMIFPSTKKFWKPCFRLQTPIFIFPQESSNSRKSWTSEKSDSAKNGLRNTRRILKKDSSRKIDAEGTNESIRSAKSHVFISKFSVFHMNQGKFRLRPAESTFRPDVRKTEHEKCEEKSENRLPEFLVEAKVMFWIWALIFQAQKY